MASILFSGLLISFHAGIQRALLPQLASPRLAVRKRSIIALGERVFGSFVSPIVAALSSSRCKSNFFPEKFPQGFLCFRSRVGFELSIVFIKNKSILTGYLVQSCYTSLYQELMQYLLQELLRNSNISTTRTYIQAIAAIW